ncbi:unnamed protein product [Trichobilharzia szidati]|nr:unnamed protein product [Trichobilharzia szidati]
MVSHSDSPILLTKSFFDLRDECHNLIDEYQKIIRAENHFKDAPFRPYSKVLAQFYIEYEELKRWLSKVSVLSFRRHPACLSRSESYVSQNYFGHMKGRDVDFDRLCSLANQLLDISGQSCKSPIIYSSDSVQESTEFDVSSRFREIQTLWDDVTSAVYPMSFLHDPPRTLKDIQLDLEETEAKLCSIDRQTCLLNDMIKSPNGKCEITSAMMTLKVEHVYLKRAVSTLLAAGVLLSQLHVSCVELGFCSFSDEVSNCPIIRLTEIKDELLRKSSSLWIRHVELREFWKCRSKIRSSFESGLSRSSLSFGNFRSLIGLDHVTANNLLFPSSSVEESTPNGLYPPKPLADVYHSVSYPKLDSKLWKTLTEHLHFEVDTTRMRDSHSSVYSLGCPESGFASDTDCQHLNSHLSNNGVVSGPFSSNSQSLKSPCSPFRDKLRSHSVDCLRTSNTSSNASEEADKDSCTELYHHDTNRTPIKSVNYSIDDNKKNIDHGDEALSNQSQRSFSFYFEQRSSFDHISQNSGDSRASSYHDLVPSVVILNDSKVINIRSSLDQIQSTFNSAENSSNMPVASVTVSNNHEMRSQKLELSSNSSRLSTSVDTESSTTIKSRRNYSISSSELCMEYHENAENEDFDDTTFSELIPSTTEFDSNSHSFDAGQKSSDFVSPMNSPNYHDINDHDGGDDNGVVDSHRTAKIPSFNNVGDGMCHNVNPSGIQATDDNHDTSVDGLEWDHLGDIRGVKSSLQDKCYCTSSSPIHNNGSVDGLTRTSSPCRVNGKVSSDVDCFSLTLAAEAAEALISPRTQQNEAQVRRRRSRATIASRRKSHTEVIVPHSTPHTEVCSSPNNYCSSPKLVISKEQSIKVHLCEPVVSKVDSSVAVTSKEEKHSSYLNLVTLGNRSVSYDAADLSMICEDDILALISSIRWDALPLIGLLSRLEGNSVFEAVESKYVRNCENQLSVQLEDERRQLDIDKSYLTHFDKRLTHWTNTMETLRSQALMISSPNKVINAETELNTTTLSVTVNTFSDWLSALKARLTMAFSILQWRTSVFDHLVGQSHDANLSLLAMKQRVHTSIQRAQETIKSCIESYDNKFTQSLNATDGDIRDGSDEFHCCLTISSSQSPNEVLNTLEELRNLNENLWNIQSRLGSCYLFDDFWRFSFHSKMPQQQQHRDDDDQSLPYQGNRNDAFINRNLSLNYSVSNLIQLSCTLRQQVLNTIRSLESAMLIKSNNLLTFKKEVSYAAQKHELIHSSSYYIEENYNDERIDGSSSSPIACNGDDGGSMIELNLNRLIEYLISFQHSNAKNSIW